MRKLQMAASTALLAAPLLLAGPAHASLISLALQQGSVNGGAITTVATDSGTGVLSYVGGYGSFTINEIQAIGAPVLKQPNLDSSAINVSSDAGGLLDVYITESGLTSPTPLEGLLSAFTSNIFNGAVTYVKEITYTSATNALFGGTMIASQKFGAIGTAVFEDAAPVSSLYSETIEYEVKTTGASDVNDTVDIAPVPEPTTLALFGGALLGLGLLRRRLF